MSELMIEAGRYRRIKVCLQGSKSPLLRTLAASEEGKTAESVFPVLYRSGGSGEIRTHGRVTPSLVFKTSALNHSATLPCSVSPAARDRLTGRFLSPH